MMDFDSRQSAAQASSGRSCASCARDIRESLYSTPYTSVCEQRRQAATQYWSKRRIFRDSRKAAAIALLALTLPMQAHALDSYRYLHVTIDTVWQIFLLLAPLVLAPFAVLVWVYWRRAVRKSEEQERDDEQR